MNEVVEPEKVLGRERHGDQELRGHEEDTQLFGHNQVELEEGEYYADIYRRSLDLLDRKYDTTPEGRREGKALLLELELMNPAPEKPRRDFLGQTADLLRRLHEHESEISAPATPACPSPSVPRIPTAPASLKTSFAETPAASAPPAPEPREHSGTGVVDPKKAPSSRESLFAANVYQQDELRGAEKSDQELSRVNKDTASFRDDKVSSVLGDGQPSLRPFSSAAQPAADATVPRYDKKHAVSSPTTEPPPAPFRPFPPAPARTPVGIAHTTDWYTPASWSGRQPDPFPSR